MIEITNKTRGPVQLVIRSRRKTNSFTTLNIPGRGSGNNVRLLEDEKMTEYVERLERAGFIQTKRIDNVNRGV